MAGVLPEPVSAGPHADEPWWKSAVVYQIYQRSFADTDGDGVGDIAGIAGRLDYLGHLGVELPWLSHVYPSPQDDAGYDISAYQGIDPTFGSLDEFDALLAAVHERGMRLVMDLVGTTPPTSIPGSSSPGRAWTTRNGTGTGGAPRVRACRLARPGRSRRTGAAAFPRAPLTLRPWETRVYRRSGPDLSTQADTP